MAVARIGGGIRIPRQRRFLTSGTWTVPTGVKWVKARIVGAGASGNIAYGSGSIGALGSSGGCVIDVIIDATPGTAMPVTVAPTTTAVPYLTAGSTSYVPGVVGANSSFGGVIAAGGRVVAVGEFSAGAPSAGIGSGYGGGLGARVDSESNAFTCYPGGDGVDGYGAGSGAAFYGTASTSSRNVSPGGRGGVPGLAVSPNNFAGLDAPANTGAAGGPLRSTVNESTSIRGGHGGSGIVILEWEEYA